MLGKNSGEKMQSKGDILDVTVLEPRQKHPTIFGRFNELDIGQSFIIHNDHDPRPLYFQMEAALPGAFRWEYEQQGPKVFRVRITRTGDGLLDAGGGCCS